MLRRRGTVAFGVLGIAGTTSFFVWTVAHPEISQSTLEYAFGGAVGGALSLVVFRAAVWPAVVLMPDKIVVRNLLVDHEITGGTPRVGWGRGGSVCIGDEHQQVFPFAFGGSVIDQVRGMPGAHRLDRALRARPALNTPLVVTRIRGRLLRQAPAFVAAGAVVGAVTHLLTGR